MVLVTKSMPTVGWVRGRYVGGELEGIVDESRDDGGFADVLVAYQNHFEFTQFRHLIIIELSGINSNILQLPKGEELENIWVVIFVGLEG